MRWMVPRNSSAFLSNRSARGPGLFDVVLSEIFLGPSGFAFLVVRKPISYSLSGLFVDVINLP